MATKLHSERGNRKTKQSTKSEEYIRETNRLANETVNIGRVAAETVFHQSGK